MIEFKSPFEYIPSELHLISLFLTAILGFFLIIGFPSAKLPLQRPTIVKSEPIDDYGSVASDENTSTPTATAQGSTSTSTPKKDLPPKTPGRRKKGSSKSSSSSPPRTPTPNIGKNTFGSVSTPLGRRSARVANRSARKD